MSQQPLDVSSKASFLPIRRDIKYRTISAEFGVKRQRANEEDDKELIKLAEIIRQVMYLNVHC